MNDIGKRILPEGWEWMRLGDVCEERTGVRDPRMEPDKQFVYVDITGVDNRAKRIVAPKTLLGIEAPSRARQLIHKEDVLVSTTRPNLNAVAIVPSELHSQICSTGFCVLRAGAGLDPAYLYLYVQTTRFAQTLSDLVKGALYPAVTDKQVKDQVIPLPPLAEQKRIAAILKKQMAVVEQARAAAEAQLEAAKALPAAYLRGVFDSPEAQKRPRRCLREVCKSDGQYGTSGKANSVGEGLAVLRMGNLREGRLDWKDLKYIELPDAERDKYLLTKGDLLFNRTNSAELVGKTAVFAGERDAVFASYLIRFRVVKEVAEPEFVSAYIRSRRGRKFIEENMTRAIGQVNISASTMHQMPIPVPPLAKQKRIVAMLQQQIVAVDQACKALEKQLETIDKLPAALLRQAFGGEL